MAVVEAVLQRVGVEGGGDAHLAVGEREGGEVAEHVVGGGRGDAERGGEAVAAAEQLGVVAGAQLGPAAGEQLAEPADRRSDAQPGGGVVGAGPVELLPQGRAGAGGGVAVADDAGVELLLAIAADVQHGGALGRADPLVEVAGVVGGAEIVEGEGDHAGAVGAVDEGVDAAVGEGPHDRGDREDEAGGGGDVIDEGEAGARADAGLQGGDDLVGVGDREGHGGDDEAGAGATAEVLQGVAAGAVDVVGGEELVAGSEAEGAEDRVDAGAGVAHEDEVVGASADEGGDVLAGAVEQGAESAEEEVDRLALHQGAQAVLLAEDDARAGAEGAVVEEDDRGVEGPVSAEIVRRRPHAGEYTAADAAHARP